ncbi:MAG: hypothetical protein ABEJ79_10430 [Halolamina sp.]
MSNDDDVDEYLDAELDGTVSKSANREPVPGPLSLSQLVFGAHMLGVVGISPLAWVALRNGNTPQFLTLTTLAALLVAAGIVTRRMAKRREP